MNRPLPWLCVLFALTGYGCYATTIRSGLPAQAKPDIQYDDKWHHGAVLGIAEISGPYDLHEICPNGWAEIKTRTSFTNGLVDLITSGLYSPQSVTIRCAAAPAVTSQEGAAAK